jgi:hypothetical protein
MGVTPWVKADLFGDFREQTPASIVDLADGKLTETEPAGIRKARPQL